MRTTGALVVCGVVSSVLLACGAGGGPGAEAPAAAPAAALAPGAAGIYDDALAAGWTDRTVGATRNLAATSPVYTGTRAITVSFQASGGILFRRTSGIVSGASALQLAVRSDAVANPRLLVAGVLGSAVRNLVPLAGYCAGGAIPSGAWTLCKVPLSALGAAGATFDGFGFQEGSGKALTGIAFDEVQLLPAASVPPPSTVVVSIAPAAPSADACGTVKLSATVTGASSTGVTWSIQEGAAGGTVDASGNYKAPNATGTFHVVATSAASPAASATVPVAVQQRILAIAVTPASATVGSGGTAQLAATISTTCGVVTAQ
jgi:chitinase